MRRNFVFLNVMGTSGGWVFSDVLNDEPKREAGRPGALKP